jgi:hypothetical protein
MQYFAGRAANDFLRGQHRCGRLRQPLLSPATRLARIFGVRLRPLTQAIPGNRLSFRLVRPTRGAAKRSILRPSSAVLLRGLDGRSYKVIPRVQQRYRLNPDQLLNYHVRTASGAKRAAVYCRHASARTPYLSRLTTFSR